MDTRQPIVAHLVIGLHDDQREEIDRYREDNKVATRTAVADEALAEFFARRKRKYPRSYGRVTGLKTSPDAPRRRATDLIEEK